MSIQPRPYTYTQNTYPAPKAPAIEKPLIIKVIEPVSECVSDVTSDVSEFYSDVSDASIPSEKMNGYPGNYSCNNALKSTDAAGEVLVDGAAFTAVAPTTVPIAVSGTAASLVDITVYTKRRAVAEWTQGISH